MNTPSLAVNTVVFRVTPTDSARLLSMLVAFVFRWVDYCRSLLSGCPRL